MSGGEFVGFNNSVFLAEKEVSDRNYALSYYMKENNCFPKGVNIKDCLDFWYQVSLTVIAAGAFFKGQCSTIHYYYNNFLDSL